MPWPWTGFFFRQMLMFPPPNLPALVAERLRSYQGGGILVLKDFPDFCGAVPLRCRANELPMISTPSQKLQG